MPLFTPDDIMAGKLPQGHVIVYDDDHYYMGGVMAELLREKGCDVTLITPANCVSEWTVNTLEQGCSGPPDRQGHCDRTTRRINAVHADRVTAGCSYSGRKKISLLMPW